LTPIPNPFTTTIGPIVTGRDVELATLNFLRRWAGTYLAELERQKGYTPGSLPRPRSWTTAPDFESWPEDQLPRVMLVSPGLVEVPLADGAGSYRAKFGLGLAVIVSAKTLEETAALAKLYCAALRAAIIQHQSLEGFAAGIEWLDENYDDLPFDDTRSLGAGQAVFAVEIDGITRRYNGPKTPAEPPDPDYSPLPEDPYATDVQVTVQRVPIVP